MVLQGQLRITKKNVCLLAVWTSAQYDLAIERIERDDSFWFDHMQQKLVTFYMECLLPEIDPRFTRRTVIRNPPSITDAQKQKKKIKN